MGDILGDDELEEMRLRDNEEAEQAGKNGSAADAAPARLEGGLGGEQQQQQKPLQPPPGFSANHLFGDVDDDPLDLVTNLSFLNDAEEVSSALHANVVLLYSHDPEWSCIIFRPHPNSTYSRCTQVLSIGGSAG